MIHALLILLLTLVIVVVVGFIALVLMGAAFIKHMFNQVSTVYGDSKHRTLL